MTGPLSNLVSFVWFPYHFDSCLNYAYTLCERGLLTGAACARAGRRSAEVGLRRRGFGVVPGDGEAMASEAVAGAQGGGGAAVPAGLPLCKAGVEAGFAA